MAENKDMMAFVELVDCLEIAAGYEYALRHDPMVDSEGQEYTDALEAVSRARTDLLDAIRELANVKA